MISKYEGELEIDHERGVIYFHDKKTDSTVLRICGLGKIQEVLSYVEITHMHGVQVEAYIIKEKNT